MRGRLGLAQPAQGPAAVDCAAPARPGVTFCTVTVSAFDGPLHRQPRIWHAAARGRGWQRQHGRREGGRARSSGSWGWGKQRLSLCRMLILPRVTSKRYRSGTQAAAQPSANDAGDTTQGACAQRLPRTHAGSSGAGPQQIAPDRVRSRQVTAARACSRSPLERVAGLLHQRVREVRAKREHGHRHVGPAQELFVVIGGQLLAALPDRLERHDAGARLDGLKCVPVLVLGDLGCVCAGRVWPRGQQGVLRFLRGEVAW